MATPTYWIGQDSNIYFGSGLDGVPVQNLGNYQTGQFEARDDGLYDRYTDSGTPTLTYSASRINDPVQTGNTGVLGSSTGGSTTPSYSQQDLDYLNAQEGRYNTMRGSLGTYLQQGLDKLNVSEEDARNRADMQNTRATRELDDRRSDSMTAKTGALNRVDTNARTLSNSLKRMLGMAGGTGGSAYKLAAPMAVARDASAKRGDVMTNFGQNERDLDQAVGDTSTDFGLIMKDIADRRKREEESLRAGIFGQEQGINSSLAEIAAERARLQGGNALSAMRPYETRYNEIQGQLTQLPNQFAVQPARDLQVKTPSLRDYLVDRTAINANRQGGQSTYSPYAQFLKPKDDEELQVR
jgi:hypothetical protein